MAESKPYEGPDRRERSGPITRAEFDGFTHRLDRRMDKQDEMLGHLKTAMFAKDDKNEFESPGVMTVLQKMSHHIDTVCMLGQTLKKIGAALIMCGAMVTAAKVIGIL